MLRPLSRFIRPELASALIVLAATGFAAAHDTELLAVLDGPHVVNPDGTMGSGSTATGDFEIGIDEDTNVFDIEEFHVEGIAIEDLDNSHGPNNSSLLLHLGAVDENGPIAIDISWYIAAGFGTIAPDGDGFTVTISAIIFSQQGDYDMEGTTGLTPSEVHVEMEEGNAYVQVYSIEHPDGEIRGQLFEAPNATEPTSWGSVKAGFATR